jgi:hypothetical protein
VNAQSGQVETTEQEDPQQASADGSEAAQRANPEMFFES